MQDAINTFLELRGDSVQLSGNALYAAIIGATMALLFLAFPLQLTSKVAKLAFRLTAIVVAAVTIVIAFTFGAQAQKAKSALPTMLASVQEELEATYALELTEETTQALLANSFSKSAVSLEVAGQEVRVELARDSGDEWRLYRNGVALPEAPAE